MNISLRERDSDAVGIQCVVDDLFGAVGIVATLVRQDVLLYRDLHRALAKVAKHHADALA